MRDGIYRSAGLEEFGLQAWLEVIECRAEYGWWLVEEYCNQVVGYRSLVLGQVVMPKC